MVFAIAKMRLAIGTMLISQALIATKAIGEVGDAVIAANNPSATVALSITLVEQGKFDQAISLLTARAKIPGGDTAQIQAALANVYLAQGKVEAAEGMALNVLKANPNYDWPLIIVINALIQQNKAPLADNYIKQLEKVGKPKDIALLKGDLLRAQNRRLEADIYYEKALKDEPKNQSIRELKSWNLDEAFYAMIEEDKIQEVEKRLARLSKKDPRYDAFKIRAKIWLHKGDPTKADAEFIKSSQRFPGEDSKGRLFNHRLDVAKSFYFNGDYENALKWANRAESTRRSPEVQALKADIFRQSGRYDLAEQYYRRSSAFAKKNAYVYEARAWNFTLAGNAEAARNTLEQGIRVDPKDPRLVVALALLNRNQQNIVKAMELLTDAKRLANENGKEERFNEIYPANFFDYTPAAGYAIDQTGVPGSLAFNAEYDMEPSDTEKIVRGLGLQKISPTDYNLFLPIANSKVARFETRFNLYAKSIPPLTFYLRQNQQVGPKSDADPSLDRVWRQAMAEYSRATPVGLGLVLGVSPFLRYTSHEGTKINNETIRAEPYQNGELSIGMRTRLQPINGLIGIEGISVVNRNTALKVENSFVTYNLGLHFRTNFVRWLTTDTDADYFISRDDPGAGKLLRTELRGGFSILLGDMSSIALHYNYVSYRDDIGDKVPVITELTRPEAKLRMWPLASIGLEAGVSQATHSKYGIYDHLDYTTSLIATPRIGASRYIYGSGPAVPYSLPMELRIGYAQSRFSKAEVPANDRIVTGQTFGGAIFGLKLFW